MLAQLWTVSAPGGDARGRITVPPRQETLLTAVLSEISVTGEQPEQS